MVQIRQSYALGDKFNSNTKKDRIEELERWIAAYEAVARFCLKMEAGQPVRSGTVWRADGPNVWPQSQVTSAGATRLFEKALAVTQAGISVRAA